MQQVTAIPAFDDNYIWVLETESQLIVVDPGEAKGVMDFIKTKKKPLAAILLTHKHEDHIGGVHELKVSYPDCPVYGPDEIAEYTTQTVRPGDTFQLLGADFQVLASPGHTEGHISYLTEDQLFCGDALFLAGCGRVFTGDYQAQYQTLQTFKALKPSTLIYCGHEYSMTNLRFAKEHDPDNADIDHVIKVVQSRLDQGESSLPSTISIERLVNPFMRAESLAAFTALRQARDNFS